MRTTRRAKKGIMTIPELRRAFEHMEEHTAQVARAKLAHESKIKSIRAEWERVFFKPLNRASAVALLDDTKSVKGGGLTSTPIAGAPLDHSTRAGVYLAPSGRPEDGLPLSGQTGGAYGSFIEYVEKGFFNPEIAQTYDPVVGQTEWPTPYAQTGSNLVGGGKSRRTHSTRRKHSTRSKHSKHSARTTQKRALRGGGLLDQAFSHPISSSNPPTALQDAQTLWQGRMAGPSPDHVQNHPVYRTTDA